MTESKNLYELDEKIELLKSELQSLLNDEKLNKNSSAISKIDLRSVVQTSVKYLESNSKQFSKSSTGPKDAEIINVNCFMPSCSSTPLKFSDWLSETIDDLNLKSSKNELFNVNNVINDSNFHILMNKISVDIDSNSSKSNAPSLSQQNIEQLLYKSLVIKNLTSGISLSDSEEDFFVSANSFKTKKYQKFCKFRKNYRNSRTLKSSQNKRKSISFFQRKKKKRRINSDSSHNDVEIINLDDSSGNYETSKIKKILPEARALCVNLGINDCDWSEPFDLNLDSGSGSHSNMIVSESNKEKEAHTSNQKESEFVQLLDSISYDEIGKGQPKRTWECPVCFERSTGQEIIATQCGHVFCKKCVESHFLNLGRLCPSCRTDLTDKPIITLFNF